MSSLRAIIVLSAAAAVLSTPGCGSDTKTATSGGAQFTIVGFPTAPVDKRCDQLNATITLSVKGSDGSDKLIVDGANGATVKCQYDDSHYSITVGNDAGSLSAYGTFQGNGKTSVDTAVSIGLSGTTYQSVPGTPCTVTFTVKEGAGLTGYFLCPEIDNQRTAAECAVTNKNPDGSSTSYFKFNDCVGF